MTTYHNFIVAMTFTARHLEDGYYAVPDTVTNFVPDVDQPVLERDDDGDEILPDDFVFLDEDEDIAWRMLALRMSDDEWGEGNVDHVRDNTFRIGRREFLVLDDDEADDAFDDYLDNYLEECVLGEVPENLRCYFDEKKWKSDARIEGRDCLASYDGLECYESTNNGTYYIYRQN